MSGNPWIRFFPSDWLAGTRGMTPAEVGTYITLIALLYERGGKLENNPARLSRLCGASNSGFKRALDTLIDEGKITVDGSYLSNNRVLEELSYTQKRSTLGRESAESRWGKKTNKNSHGADANAMRQQCDGNAVPDANQKPEARKKKDSTPKPYGVVSFKAELMTVLDEPYAQAVIDHRKAKRAPITKHAASLFLKSLSTCADKYAAIDMMIERNWTTIKQEWVDNASTPRQGGRAPPSNPIADAFANTRRKLGIPDEPASQTIDITPNA